MGIHAEVLHQGCQQFESDALVRTDIILQDGLFGHLQNIEEHGDQEACPVFSQRALHEHGEVGRIPHHGQCFGQGLAVLRCDQLQVIILHVKERIAYADLVAGNPFVCLLQFAGADGQVMDWGMGIADRIPLLFAFRPQVEDALQVESVQPVGIPFA